MPGETSGCQSQAERALPRDPASICGHSGGKGTFLLGDFRAAELYSCPPECRGECRPRLFCTDQPRFLAPRFFLLLCFTAWHLPLMHTFLACVFMPWIWV